MHSRTCIGAPPFRDKSEYLTMERVSTQEYACPDHMPPHAQSLVKQLLLADPAQRLGMPGLTGCAWRHRILSADCSGATAACAELRPS